MLNTLDTLAPPVESTGTAADKPLDQLFAEVYEELCRLAHHQRRPQDGATLSTTALVHELYLQMRRGSLRFEQSRQFFAYAARAMRHLLVDRARERRRLKHGGDLRRAELDDDLIDHTQTAAEQAIELDEVLRQLATDDARAAQIVELHYFAGLSMEKIAELLECSPRTVYRDWRYARAYLHQRLGG